MTNFLEKCFPISWKSSIFTCFLKNQKDVKLIVV